MRDAGFYFEGALNILRLKGAETVYSWVSDTVFTLSVVSGAENIAIANGMNLMDRDLTDVNPTAQQIQNVVDKIEQLQPDVVIAGPRFAEGCLAFMKELKRRNVVAGAILVRYILFFLKIVNVHLIQKLLKEWEMI